MWKSKHVVLVPMSKLRTAYRLPSVHFVLKESRLGKDFIILLVESATLSVILLIFQESPEKE